ncbi:MAG TPA: DUF4856 domain-containing protein, partial [Flavitalea sp.]|nr:DUF4856 domain-containing protein [Flavitalea sp.]
MNIRCPVFQSPADYGHFPDAVLFKAIAIPVGYKRIQPVLRLFATLHKSSDLNLKTRASLLFLTQNNHRIKGRTINTKRTDYKLLDEFVFVDSLQFSRSRKGFAKFGNRLNTQKLVLRLKHLTMKKIFVPVLALAVFTLNACKKDNNGPAVEPYTVPETYNFQNVDYKEATARVRMLDGINKYMSTTQSSMDKVTLDQTKVDNMWTNSNSPFDTAWLNTSGVNISEKTADAATYKGYLDGLVAASAKDLTPAANGTPGYIARSSGKILVNDNGLEFVQAVQKGTMGAALFKEAMVLLDQVPGSDNTKNIEETGTAMAHN